MGRPDHGLVDEDEQLKVQMFRFVDVLPMLADAMVSARLSEYLGEATSRWVGRVDGDSGWRGASIAWALAMVARLGATDFARRFIAGEQCTPQVLGRPPKRERKLRRAFTLDILGEAVISDAEAEQYFRAYLDLIEGVAPEVVNAWPEVPQIDRRPWADSARQRLGQALGARQPVRSDRPGGHGARVGRHACASCCAPPGASRRSSTSTWSRTQKRT